MAGLLMRMNNHLGDTPGVFSNSNYVGLIFEFPFRVTWVDQKIDTASVIIETREVETWGGWAGHPVFLNGIEIGRIQDPANQNGASEITTLSITKADHADAFKRGAHNRLKIAVEKKNTHPGLLDDFLLLSYCLEGFSGTIGW